LEITCLRISTFEVTSLFLNQLHRLWLNGILGPLPESFRPLRRID